MILYKKENIMYDTLRSDVNYELIYDDDDFALFKKLGTPTAIVSYSDGKNMVAKYKN